MAKFITLFFILLSGLSVTFSTAAAQEEERIFLDQINAIRQAPFSYALTLGYSQSQLNSTGLNENTSLAPYEADNSLDTLASQLNQSAMGIEIAAEKQIPVSSRISDTGGVLEFSNYISVDAAEKIFIDNLLKKEIKSGDFQYILSDSYARAGVSVLPGNSQSNKNAWFFTLCVDTQVLMPEAILMTLINQLRADPWNVIEINIINNHFSPNIELNTARALVGKRPPVFSDRALLETARIDVETKAKDEISTDYIDIPGYDGVVVEKNSGSILLDNDTQDEAVSCIFEKLLKSALDNFHYNPGLLNYDTTDIGLAVISTESEDDSVSMVFSVNTGILETTTKEQSSSENSENRIYGILYIDKNKDGLYSPGEEVCDRDISVWEQNAENEVMITTTDHAGRFILTLPSKKRYRFSCTSVNSSNNTESFELYKYLYKDLFLSFALPLSEE